MIESNADLFFKKLKKMRNGKKRRELDDIFKVFSVNFPLENADVINRFHILREILDYLVNSEKISYPNSKKNWDKSTRPELPKWIKILINVSNENNTYLKEIPWHPELIQFSNVKNIKKSSYKDLKALNDYFSLNDIKNLPEISIKERSYQIFKDEKKLEKIIKTDWFGSRLDLTQLRCYRTLEPFAVKTFSRALFDKLIIIENRDTFNSFIKANLLLKIPYYKYIVYGNGYQIIDTILWIEILDQSLSEIYYFGDVDEEGFKIAELAKMKIENKKITFHLSEPFYKMSYQKFQEIRSNSSFEGEFIDDLNISFLNLSDTLKIEFLKLFKNSQRIPQEILTSFDINKILQDFEN